MHYHAEPCFDWTTTTVMCFTWKAVVGRSHACAIRAAVIFCLQVIVAALQIVVIGPLVIVVAVALLGNNLFEIFVIDLFCNHLSTKYVWLPTPQLFCDFRFCKVSQDLAYFVVMCLYHVFIFIRRIHFVQTLNTKEKNVFKSMVLGVRSAFLLPP